MAEHPAFTSGMPVPPMSLTEIRDDLKRKQELLAAACRCLDDERSYRFFCHLASASEMASERRDQLLNQLESLGEYKTHEMNAIRRLVMSDGAVAFKNLVDLVRDIRIEQEIEAIMR